MLFLIFTLHYQSSLLTARQFLSVIKFLISYQRDNTYYYCSLKQSRKSTTANPGLFFIFFLLTKRWAQGLVSLSTKSSFNWDKSVCWKLLMTYCGWWPWLPIPCLLHIRLLKWSFPDISYVHADQSQICGLRPNLGTFVMKLNHTRIRISLK